jgi:hypothetical protein
MRLAPTFPLLIVLTWACATAPAIPPEQPDILPTADSTAALPSRVLQLTSGSTVYEFVQSSEIHPETIADTRYSSIRTEALFSVTMSAQNDSVHELMVSVDSLRITTTGSAPGHSQGLNMLPFSLGAVLRASFTPQTRSMQRLLPDSLCAYGHLESAAQEILLLPLPSPALLGEANRWSDSSRSSTCRAGTTIETHRHHEITYLANQPNELSLRSTAIVQGAGLMRTDSLTVSGTVTTVGKATLNGDDRLPIRLQTQSHGTISIQLGDSTTTFQQESTQEWRRRLP